MSSNYGSGNRLGELRERVKCFKNGFLLLFLFCGCVRVPAGTYAHSVGVSDQRGWRMVPELELQGGINHPT